MSLTNEVITHMASLLPVTRIIYLWGPPGVGKTYLAINAFTELKIDSWIVTLDEDRMVQELLGHYIPKGGAFVWHDGPVALAVRHGGLIINELPRASGAVKDMLLSVLDNPASFSISLPTGENLHNHENFCVVLTGNESPDKAGLDGALVDRLNIIIEIPVPTDGVIAYLNTRRQQLGNAIRNSYMDKKNAISPRKAIAIADLMDRLSYKADLACRLVLGEKMGESFVLAWKSLYKESEAKGT